MRFFYGNDATKDKGEWYRIPATTQKYSGCDKTSFGCCLDGTTPATSADDICTICPSLSPQENKQISSLCNNVLFGKCSDHSINSNNLNACNAFCDCSGAPCATMSAAPLASSETRYKLRCVAASEVGSGDVAYSSKTELSSHINGSNAHEDSSSRAWWMVVIFAATIAATVISYTLFARRANKITRPKDNVDLQLG